MTSLLRRCAGWVTLVLAGASSAFGAVAPTPLIASGSDAQKLVFAVVGDGYAAADQAKYIADVDHLIVSGVFAHDIYQANLAAFNVYRFDVVSDDSGVTAGTVRHNTAFGTVYNGQQPRCWVTSSARSEDLVLNAVASLTKIDFIVVLVNTTGYGGCSRGRFLYVTDDSPWEVAAHEYGHGIGKLFDEYAGVRAFPQGQTLNELNCSTGTSRGTIAWSSMIGVTTAIPTTFTAGMNENTTIGAFVGCNNFASGIHRPVQTCRMRKVDHGFCPVCTRIMSAALAPHLSAAPVRSNTLTGQGQAPGRGGPATSTRSTGAPPSGRAAPAPQFVQTGRGAPAPQPPQTGRGAAADAPSFVNLWFRITTDGNVTIVRAAEGRGTVTQSATPSRAFFELTADDRPPVLGAVPDEIFTERSYSPDGTAAHSDQASQETTTSVTIPNMDLQTLSRANTTFAIYRLRAGAAARVVNADSVATWRAQDQLIRQTYLPAQQMRQLLQQRLQRQ